MYRVPSIHCCSVHWAILLKIVKYMTFESGGVHDLECFEEPGNLLKLKISFLEPFKMFEIFDYEFQTWKIDWTHAYNFPNTQLNVRLITDKSIIPIHQKVSMGEGDRNIQTRMKAGSHGPPDLGTDRSGSVREF